MIWRRYTFDRQLRLLLIDAIERAEIAVRTQVVYHHTQLYGPFGYCDPARLRGISPADHADLLRRLREEAERSREDFVKHFQRKYAEETDLPLWMASELMTFGNMLTLFRGVEQPLKQAIARHFGVADTVLESWLHVLNHVRNICAHHGRMWNRVLGLKPLIPRPHKHPDWHVPVTVPNERVYAVLTILQFLLRQVAPHTAWRQRLLGLFARYPDISLTPMGFPPSWDQSPLWRP
jgi:abortive infection bacteriophage resistance protein